MSCSCRRMFPSEIAALILSSLNVAAHERNLANPEKPKILATIQTDDPHAPDAIKIDVDFPTDENLSAVKSHYITRLEISRETGAIKFFPTGYESTGEPYELGDVHTVTKRMIERIQTS